MAAAEPKGVFSSKADLRLGRFRWDIVGFTPWTRHYRHFPWPMGFLLRSLKRNHFQEQAVRHNKSLTLKHPHICWGPSTTGETREECSLPCNRCLQLLKHGGGGASRCLLPCGQECQPSHGNVPSLCILPITTRTLGCCAVSALLQDAFCLPKSAGK